MRAVEVIEDEKTSLLQIRSKSRCFAVRYRPEPRLGEICDRESMQCRIIGAEHVPSVHEWPDRAQLPNDLHQILLGARKVMVPFQITTPATTLTEERVESDARENEAAIVGCVSGEDRTLAIAASGVYLLSGEGRRDRHSNEACCYESPHLRAPPSGCN